MNMEKLYKEIAREHKTTPEKVEKEITKAIKQAYWKNPNQEIFKNGLPTNKEFINHVSNKAKKSS